MRYPILLFGVVFTAVLGACASRPAGRVEIGDTTPAESNSPGPSTAQLAEATDGAAQALRLELGRLLPPPGSGERGGLILGRMDNLTEGLIPSTEIELARERMLAKLDFEGVEGGRFMVFASRADHDRFVRESMLAQGDDLLGRGGGPRRSPLDARYTFELATGIGSVERGTTRLVVHRFSLHRLSDGARVWASYHESKRDGGKRPAQETPGPAGQPAPTASSDRGEVLRDARDTVDLADRIRDLSDR